VRVEFIPYILGASLHYLRLCAAYSSMRLDMRPVKLRYPLSSFRENVLIVGNLCRLENAAVKANFFVDFVVWGSQGLRFLYVFTINGIFKQNPVFYICVRPLR
jgi:hypothetical protein